MLIVAFTSLLDQLHAAVWRAGDEAVAQVPTRQLPCIYAGQPVNGHIEHCKFKDYFNQTQKEAKKHFKKTLNEHPDSLWFMSVPTRLHPSLEPRRWWPSPCPSCGLSLRAAARWGRGQTSSRLPLWYCEEPTDRQTDLYSQVCHFCRVNLTITVLLWHL